MRELVYDGLGPDAFFLAGGWLLSDFDVRNSTGLSGSKPSDLLKPADLVVLPFPPPTANFPLVQYKDPSILPLPAFSGTDEIILKLPDTVAVPNLRWLSVWCRAFSLDFGHVKFPVA